ncbi:MAG: flagellar motor protein MotB [Bryobacteraceae bacterium]
MRHRNKNTGHHANHDRWIVSYADFVTLLFAFFVVMFATANADKGKARAVGESVRAALEEGRMSNVGDAIRQALSRDGTTSPVHKRDVAKKANGDREAPSMEEQSARAYLELRPLMDKLKKQLQAEVQKGDVEVHMEPRGLAISFKQAALFASGEDRLKTSAFGAIGKVGGAIRDLPNQARLEGNTDNVPIHNERFRSNWELSAARSIALLNLLIDRFQVPPERLGVAGYADVAPVASNATEEGRARNRRVDVVILSERAARAEPAGKLNPPGR